MSESGQVLRNYNDKIVRCLNELKVQREEIKVLIDKQNEEKKRLQNEIERITYKLMIITKSVTQRISTLEDYNRTIKEAEEQYYMIVNDSCKLVDRVQQYVTNLEGKMDKKTGTDSVEVNLNEAKEMLIEKRLTELYEENEEKCKKQEEEKQQEQQQENIDQEGDDDDDEESNNDPFGDQVSITDNLRSLTPSTAHICSSTRSNYSNPIAQLAREHNPSGENTNNTMP